MNRLNSSMKSRNTIEKMRRWNYNDFAKAGYNEWQTSVIVNGFEGHLSNRQIAKFINKENSWMEMAVIKAQQERVSMFFGVVGLVLIFAFFMLVLTWSVIA